jgi:hydroxyacylglutathione hydrolase
MQGNEIAIGGHVGRVLHVPGHTLGHIAFIFDEARVAFVGDTMFAMGCGRLFEGTPEQMYDSLQTLAALPDDYLVYCAHEYTLANARFAAHAEPDNEAIAERLAKVEALRLTGTMTLPSSVGEEHATNPFVRASNWQEFAALRSAKDSFGS